MHGSQIASDTNYDDLFYNKTKENPSNEYGIVYIFNLEDMKLKLPNHSASQGKCLHIVSDTSRETYFLHHHRDGQLI